MTRLTQALLIVIVVLAALIAAGPTIVRLVQALVPLALTVGVFAVILQVLRYYNGR